jgi:8-oxo-dGTP pyrophosphatase MutT (NUDIX family)
MTDDGLEALLSRRLDPLEAASAGALEVPRRSDYDLNPHVRPGEPRTLKPAAVLAAIVRRPQGWTMLLTRRTAEMPTHAGQVAFPGGRVQAEDRDPVATALREAQEETGVDPRFVTPIGTFDAYETVTGFRVVPIVAVVEPGFTLNPDPREVAQVFEAPWEFLMNPANHERHEREWQGTTRAYYAMPYQGHYIWGATAGMIKALYDRLYGDRLYG